MNQKRVYSREILIIQYEVNQLIPGLHSKLLVQTANVVFYGRNSDKKRVSDFPVALPFQQELDDILFPLSNVMFFKNRVLPQGSVVA